MIGVIQTIRPLSTTAVRLHFSPSSVAAPAPTSAAARSGIAGSTEGWAPQSWVIVEGLVFRASEQDLTYTGGLLQAAPRFVGPVSSALPSCQSEGGSTLRLVCARHLWCISRRRCR
jgi:hypothetical protein